MKRILSLIAVVLAIASMAQAQVVYSSGYYYGTDGYRVATVYRDGERIWEYDSSESTSEDIFCEPNSGDLYWVQNSYISSNTYNYGDVFRNGQRYLSNPVSSGTHIFSIYWDADNPNQVPEECLYSIGTMPNSNGYNRPAVWRGNNSTPVWQFGLESDIPSSVYGMVSVKMNNGSGNDFAHYYCGQIDGCAAVWKDDDVLYPYLSGYGSCAFDIDYYNGSVYTVGYEEDPSSGNQVATVWCNDVLLYQLTNAYYDFDAWEIEVVGGIVYVCGGDGSDGIVWKDGTPWYEMDVYDIFSFDVDESGVYSAATGSSTTCYVYKNDQLLYSIDDCYYLKGISVYNPCEVTEARTLPYFEGFEMGETEWQCWTTYDEGYNFDDDNDYVYNSYWNRGYADIEPYEGEYCAMHGYNGDYDQEGWLISPPIYLQPNRDYTYMYFMSYEEYPYDMRYEGVWISTEGTDPSQFTELWQQDYPNNSWQSIEIDLSDYQGEVVYIAFKYAGLDGNRWYIDNISIEEGWQPCSVISSYPFLDDFEGENLNFWCYHIYDEDHSGDQRNWMISNSASYSGSKSLEHPWGQPNMPQEGWAIAPTFDLEAGKNYTLSFMNMNYSSGPNMHNSVWVAIDNDYPEPADFTMIWESNGFPTSWTEVTIDLTPYAGHYVSVAFKYEGTYAHDWNIDDLRVEEGAPEYTIMVNSNNASWGTVQGGGTYTQGSTCTITATPNNGYEFLKWTQNNVEVSTNPSYTFTVTDNATYTAIFGDNTVTYYTITTGVNPAGTGSVEGGGTYEAGSTIYLTASPNTGWHFSHWNDGIASNPRSVVVESDATFIAYFMQEEYTLTVTATPEEGGTVSGGGIYHYGDEAVLKATPNDGYSFFKWNDGNTQSTRYVTVTGNASYSAIFTNGSGNNYTVTVTSSNPFLGSVYGGGTYPEGATILIGAEANLNAHFTQWQDGNTDNPRQVVVNSDMTFTAQFAVNQQYTIVVESANPNMGSVEGGGTYQEGTSIVIRAIPFQGYYFTSWNDGNADNPRTVVVTDNFVYVASFSDNAVVTYTINAMCNPNEGIVLGGGTYQEGTVVSLLASPKPGFEFDCWNDGNTSNPRVITVEGNATYVAFFKGNAVGENELPMMAIYPNPAHDVIRIEGLEANSEVDIFNAFGVLVKTVSANADEEIGIGELAAGIYVARCGKATLRFVKI